MPSAFKNAVAAAVGTVSTDVYTAPALTATTIIGLSLANISDVSVTTSVILTKGAVTVSLIKNAPVPVGGALILFGGGQKLVLEAGNKFSVISSAASSIDVVVSVLEIS